MIAHPAAARALLLTLLLGATTGAGLAAEQETESGNAPAEQEEQHSADPTTEPPEENAESSPEVFVPSEEISEDFAAPFPVDI